MIAPNAGSSCPGPLTVTLYNTLGQQLPNPLTCSQIGQVVTARVRHTSSGNFCNGTLEVFDALAPVLSACADKFVFCNADVSPASVGMPGASDNCTAAADLNFSHLDQETQLGCGTFQNGVQVLRRIDRHWTVSDDHGNSSTCLQRVWVKHISFSDITFPANRDNISSPALPCGQDPNDLELAGEPTVNGVPVGASPDCEMAITHSDQTIVHCAPAGYTVLRTWTAIDFCTGTLSNRIQIIKVEDKVAPELIAPADVTVGTDGFYCTGSITLPQATVSDNCSSVSVLPSWTYGSGYGPFSSIPEGVHTVTYTATDGCGNTATAEMLVTVVDQSPPQAICASDLQVSLSANGAGFINANTIDAGSFDNCGPVFLSISRDEENYFPQIQVGCADQGMPLMLTLKVTDAVGLENLCQMEVSVRDFLKPTVQCPAAITLNCLQDYTDLGLCGQATASDNCGLQTLVHQDILNIQPCNVGSVTRWWTATDLAGNTKSCSQVITVNLINTTTVNFPANRSVNACADSSALLPAATGAPVIGGQSCSPLSVNYTDQVFNGIAPACFRIFRSWKVVDHCIYNPNGGSAGIWEATQIIDVVDNTPPQLQLPSDITVGADPFNCLGLVNLSDALASDCSDQVTITHNSAYSGAGNTVNASGQYPHGVHFVTFTATDACGNSAQQTLRITVKDLTPPTAVCLSGRTAQIQTGGSVSPDPQDLDGGCVDACSPQNSLLYSLTPAEFTCQQLGLQQVTLTVRDTAGLTATCQTQILIQDNTQQCGGGGSNGATIEGRVRTESGAAVHNIPLVLTGDGFYEETACDTTGYYAFADVPTGFDYVLRPHNNANWLNGLTTYDLVLISKHILGTDPLDSPYQMIAADANKSGSITTFDIVQFRKMILGILDSLPDNQSWRFIDSSYVFPNVQNPFAQVFPEEIAFNPLNSTHVVQNFVGLKVGDVNSNTDPAQARDPRDTLWLQLPDRSFNAGETFSVPLRLSDWSALEGFQFELNTQHDMLECLSVSSGNAARLDEQHFIRQSEGRLRVSFDNARPAPAGADTTLFVLHFKAKTNGALNDAIQLNINRIQPEAYVRTGEERLALALRIGDNPASGALAQLLRVWPNPSAGAFEVYNPLPGAAQHLRLMNSLGQTVWSSSGLLPEHILIPETATRVPGVYMLELETEGVGVLKARVVRL